ncbi:MAG: TolC family protein [Rhodothermales bacterium]|nr:TolC family protein [Rhodothermales bacterium]
MRVFLALGLLWAVTPAAARQPAPPDPVVLDLATVLAEVRTNNPTLRTARLQAEALGQRAPQVSALPDPTVGVVVQPFPVLTARGAQRSQWRVEQMIPYPGKRALRAEIADLGAEVAAHEAEVMEADLLLRAKHAYYELYRLQEAEALVEAFRDDVQGFEDVAAVRYEVGQGGQQAILRAQLEKNQLAARLLALRRQRRSAAEMLAHLTDAHDAERFVHRIRLAPPPVPDAEAVLLRSVAVRERAELDVLTTALERADRQIALAKKAAFPDFGVSLTYFDIADRAMPPTADGRDALALGASVTVPLWRGRLRAQLAEVRLHRKVVQARQADLRAEIRTEIDDLTFALEQEAEALHLYETTLLPQARTTAEAALAAYASGQAGFLDLLDAARAVFTLRMEYEDTLARTLTTAADLERALGIDALSDLDALVLRDAANPQE